MPEIETTEDQRILALSKHLSTLLGLKGFHLKPAKNKSKLALAPPKSLPIYKHKFSHIAREYMPVHAVISSAQLPPIADMRTSWVASSGILDLSLPTASKTIWEIHTGVKAGKKTRTPVKRKAATQTNSISGYFSSSQTPVATQEVTILEAEISEVEEAVEVLIATPRKKRRIQESDSDE
jgi:hypothetical protein